MCILVHENMVQAYIISVFSSSWYKYNRFCLPKSVLDESLVAFLCSNNMFFFQLSFIKTGMLSLCFFYNVLLNQTFALFWPILYVLTCSKQKIKMEKKCMSSSIWQEYYMRVCWKKSVLQIEPHLCSVEENNFSVRQVIDFEGDLYDAF